jgi:hypothetical protein
MADSIILKFGTLFYHRIKYVRAGMHMVLEGFQVPPHYEPFMILMKVAEHLLQIEVEMATTWRFQIAQVHQ